jgi:hypothetical protein
MTSPAIKTASNVFMVFVLASFPVLQKGSNIQPSPRASVAQVSLAFPIQFGLFRQTIIGLTRRGALLPSTPL